MRYNFVKIFILSMQYQENRKDIRALSIGQLAGYMEEIGEKPFRAKQVYQWLWEKSASDFSGMTNLSGSTREKLSDIFFIAKLEPLQLVASNDGTRKLLFAAKDGNQVEGVLIPASNRATACISSQVGCPLGCLFCATGTFGYTRNLTAGEIIDQVHELNKLSEQHHGRGLSNIVFMGMGEPLLNYDEVKKAVEILTSEKGKAMSYQRLTLSSAGLTEKIMQLADDGVKIQLAISLHSANNEKRSHLMPVNRSNPLPALSEAIAYYHAKTGKRVTYEYLLLQGFNDSLRDARDLAGFCKVAPCKINLIEYNAVEGSQFKTSPPANRDAFKAFLEEKNLLVQVRRSRGLDIEAACGQLACKNVDKGK